MTHSNNRIYDVSFAVFVNSRYCVEWALLKTHASRSSKSHFKEKTKSESHSRSRFWMCVF